MIAVPKPKAMAKALRAALASDDVALSHSRALEIVAAQFGLPNWNVLAAATSDNAAEIRLYEPAPVVRIFDEDKAREFYLDFLGFQTEWEHRFEPSLPLYASIVRDDLRLHLSGHHGDGSPGVTIYVAMRGIRAFQKELLDKAYSNARPGIEPVPWGLAMELADPFGNRLRFCEEKDG